MKNPNINQLRAKLLATLDDLRDREQPMEPDRARAIAAVAGVLVDSARVEVEFIRATGGDTSTFLSGAAAGPVAAIEGDGPRTTFAGGVHPIAQIGVRQ